MILSGEPLPNAIVIRLPASLVATLTNQYAAIGVPDRLEDGVNLAIRAAVKHIDRVVQKYIPAGTPYVIIDENGEQYPHWTLLSEMRR